MPEFLEGQPHGHGLRVADTRPCYQLNVSVFIEGQIQIQKQFDCNDAWSSHVPLLHNGLFDPSIQLQGLHSWLQPRPESIHDCLRQYIDCKALEPLHTSALIALPRWHRKKSWHKLTRGMTLVHQLDKFADNLADVVDTVSYFGPTLPANAMRWSYDIWYDPPVSPMHCNFSTEEGESLMMVFPGIIRAAPVQILIDSGASHNFIDQSLCQKLGLTINKDPGQVACGGNATVSSLGYVHVQLQMQSYVETVRLIVMPVADTAAFQVVLGQQWLRQHGASIDYTHECVSLRHNNRQHVLACGLSGPDYGCTYPLFRRLG